MKPPFNASSTPSDTTGNDGPTGTDGGAFGPNASGSSSLSARSQGAAPPSGDAEGDDRSGGASGDAPDPATTSPPETTAEDEPEEAPVSDEERRRLQTLEGYNVLDSPPAEAFDRITNLATRLFDVKVAMINFIDRDDQWCVSARGLQASRVPREASFCSHTIQQDEVMIVPDAADDERFTDNPFVTGEPNVRFYAGAPLTAPNGYRLGSLCLIDDEPHTNFSEADQEALTDLAGVVMDELNLRHHAYHLDDTLQAQQETDAHTTRILESITDAFFALDDDWQFTYVNSQAEDFLERPREELVGRSVWEEFEEAVDSTFYTEYQRAVENRETVEFIEYYPPLDRWFEVKAFPFVGGLSVYFDDVTERIQAQQDLRRERDLTEAIIDTSIAAIVTVDADGTVSFANDRAGEILGALADDLIGRDHLDAGPIYNLDGVKIDRDEWPFTRVLQTGDPIEDERFVVRTDDGERIVSVNGAPLYAPDGDIRQVVFSMVDITEQIERQRELEAAKNEAERASRLKSSFLANLSHDVRTPLSSIMSLTELLAREAPEDCQDRIRLIERSSHRLLDTIDSVLDLSKIESGSVDVNTRPMDVGDELLGTIEIFQPQATEKGIELRTDVAEGDLDAELDPTMLHRVTDNLISNALKFTESGGTVTVRAYADTHPSTDAPPNSAEAATEASASKPAADPGTDVASGAAVSGDVVVIEVEDTGVGIDDDFLPDLFEAFARGPEQAGHEGNGLGLAITKRLTELMGGEIAVDSKKGVGTRFTVTLPQERA